MNCVGYPSKPGLNMHMREGRGAHCLGHARGREERCRDELEEAGRDEGKAGD